MEIVSSLVTDKQLVEKIRFGDVKEKRIAQSNFYKRYAGYIYKIALQGSSNYREPEFLAKEILQKTFIKAYEYISDFNLEENLTGIEINRIIKAWLGKIGNKILVSTLVAHSNEQVKIVQLDFEELKIPLKNEENNEEQPITNILLRKLHLALDELKEKDKHIVLTYAAEDCIDNKRHLSKNAMNFLCTVYNTNPVNVRQRKKRALDKIKKKCFDETN